MNPLKNEARFKWLSIHSSYISAKFLTGKHCPCPICGGKDRFRYEPKSEHGSYFCSVCGAGTGIHLLAQVSNCSHSEAWRLVEKVIGTAVKDTRVAPSVNQEQRVRDILKSVREGTLVHDYFLSRSLKPQPEGLLQGSYFVENERSDCMIAKIAIGNRLVGLHCTYIKDGAKFARRMYAIESGGLVGGAIRLNRLHDSDTLIVGEGIETSWAAHLLFGYPAWSAMDAGKLESVIIPDQVKRVIICGDNDESFTGQKSAYTLAKRLKEQGKVVEVKIPEKVGTDWNDFLLAQK